MVKHGRDKKRRSGRIGKTKLKNRSWVRYDPNLKINTVLKEHWDVTETPSTNLSKLGLIANPNISLSTNTTTNETIQSKKPIIELFDIPDSDGIYRDPNKAQRQYPMSYDDELYILKCLNKYGTDYCTMFRDIKINTMQHTEDKLRKLGSRYILLSSEQRRIQHDIPQNVQQIIAVGRNKK